MKLPSRVRFILRDPPGFIARVLTGFRANQGFLLAGAVAYYTLLSIVPMFALILVVLSQLIDPQHLHDITRDYLALVAPGSSPALMAQIDVFTGSWKLVGIVGLTVMLFFSTLAFTSLENAMSVIFNHRVVIRRRHFLVSAVLPYVYILLLGLGLLVVTLVNGSMGAMDIGGYRASVIYALGVVGEVLMLTSIYLVMPVGRLPWHHALVGGITAAILWELTRRLLVWYLSTLSVVNLVYGTLATAVVILLSLEVATLILLLGAQVIASYEQISVQSGAPKGLNT